MSGIIHVLRNGLMWREAPERYGPPKPSITASFIGARAWNSARSLSVTLGADVELRAFGTKKDGGQPSHAAWAQFRKYSMNVNYWRPLPSPVEGVDVQWTSALLGQWSRHTLFSTERISAGGMYSVRCFKDQSVSGDVGRLKDG